MTKAVIHWVFFLKVLIGVTQNAYFACVICICLTLLTDCFNDRQSQSRFNHAAQQTLIKISKFASHMASNAQQEWLPYKTNDMNIIESLQRRALKHIPSFREIPYEDRLRRTNLMPLETRKLRADLIKGFKLMHGYDEVDPEMFFIMRAERLDTQSTRYHGKNFF